MARFGTNSPLPGKLERASIRERVRSISEPLSCSRWQELQMNSQIQLCLLSCACCLILVFHRLLASFVDDYAAQSLEIRRRSLHMRKFSAVFCVFVCVPWQKGDPKSTVRPDYNTSTGQYGITKVKPWFNSRVFQLLQLQHACQPSVMARVETFLK